MFFRNTDFIYGGVCSTTVELKCGLYKRSMKSISVLASTGGTPELRRHVFLFLDEMGIKHDHSIFTARAVFAIIADFLENNSGSALGSLLESLDDILDGKFRSAHLVRHLQKAAFCLMGELDDSNEAFFHVRAASSATIVPIGDDDGEILPPTRKETVPRIIQTVLWLMVVATWVSVYNHVTASPDFTTNLPVKDRPVENPNVILLPPSAENRRVGAQRSRSTVYIDADRSVLKGSGIEPERSTTRVVGFATRLAFHAWIMFKHGNMVLDEERFTLVSGDKYAEKKDVRKQEVTLWTKYLFAALDPVYLPSERQLKILLSAQHAKGGPLLGLMFSHLDHVWVRSEGRRGVGPVDMRDRIMVIITLIHEFAHRAHLVTEFVATDCNKHLCKNILELGHPSEETDRELDNIRDEVGAVLWLGYVSETITYDDAIILNRAILDMRIRRLYANALTSEIYKRDPEQNKPWNGYWSTHYTEFFAEASVAFVIGVDPNQRSFRHRNWIKRNDPMLFSLLDEVWAGVNYRPIEQRFKFFEYDAQEPRDSGVDMGE